ncbi:SDR family NAD(P)-dependent oxidoreductase [Thermodesulfobacteriota bacterium]
MGNYDSSEKYRERRGRALVTGASSGIGKAFVERLAREKYDLIIVARNRERLIQIAEQFGSKYGVEIEILCADLSNDSERRIVEEKVAGEPNLELLVNNAGFATIGRFAELDIDREESEIGVNVLAVVKLTRAVLPGMISRGHGAVINVSSVEAFMPDPYNATYGATKSYVKFFTEALSEELRGTGVRIQVLCPGFTRTEFQERAGIDASEISSFAWMTPEAVVDASLSCLRRGKIICIPGLINKILVAIVQVFPGFLVRRFTGVAMKRLLP